MGIIFVSIIIASSILLLVLYKNIREKIFKFDTIKKALNRRVADILDKILFFVCLLGPAVSVFVIQGVFGTTGDVDDIYSDNSTLLCIQRIIHTGGASFDIGGVDSPDTFKIYAVDLDTGEVKYRKNTGEEFIFYGWSDGLGWYQSKTGIFQRWYPSKKGIFALDTGGTSVCHITEDQLIKIPELSIGVASYNLNADTFLLEVQAKDGADYILDPLTLQMASEDQLKAALGKKPDNNEDGDNSQLPQFFVTQEIRAQLVNEKKEAINDKLFFLNGKILQVSYPLQKIIIMSYETTDKKKFILHCLSFDGKAEWEVRQSDLHIKNILALEPVTTVDESMVYKNSLIIIAGGYVLSLDLTRGDLIWKTRL